MPNKIIIDEITTLRLLHDTRKNMQKYCQGQKNAPIKKALIEGYALFGDEKVACQKVKDILLAQISEVNFNPYAFKSTTKEEDKAQQKAVKKASAQNKNTLLLKKQICEEIAYQQSLGKMTDVSPDAAFSAVGLDKENFYVKIVGRDEPLTFKLFQYKGKFFSSLGRKAVTDPKYAKKGFDNSTYKMLSELENKEFTLQEVEKVANVGKRYLPSMYKGYLGIDKEAELSPEQQKELDILNSLTAADQLRFVAGVKQRTKDIKNHQKFFDEVHHLEEPIKLIKDEKALQDLFKRHALPDKAALVQDEFIDSVVKADKKNLWNGFTKAQDGNSRFSDYDIFISNLISKNSAIFKEAYDFESGKEVKAPIKTAFDKVKSLSIPPLPNELCAEIVALGIFQQGVFNQPSDDKLAKMNQLLNEFNLNINFLEEPVVKAPDESIVSGAAQLKIDRNAFEEDKRTPVYNTQKKLFHKQLSKMGIEAVDEESTHHYLALKYNGFVGKRLNSLANYVSTAREHPWNVDGHHMTHQFDTAGEFLVADDKGALSLMDFNRLRKSFNNGGNLTLRIPILQVRDALNEPFHDLLPSSENKEGGNGYIACDKNAKEIIAVPAYCLDGKGGRSISNGRW